MEKGIFDYYAAVFIESSSGQTPWAHSPLHMHYSLYIVKNETQSKYMHSSSPRHGCLVLSFEFLKLLKLEFGTCYLPNGRVREHVYVA